jgi:hypothetical protein
MICPYGVVPVMLEPSSSKFPLVSNVATVVPLLINCKVLAPATICQLLV